MFTPFLVFFESILFAEVNLLLYFYSDISDVRRSPCQFQNGVLLIVPDCLFVCLKSVLDCFFLCL